ncbi:MAG TPA: hypothetical protein VEU30_04240, partial [Thermoanaerobaculia bacterium]|nr:hypothetical protein [Thermoanaerobaculia bacterium]
MRKVLLLLLACLAPVAPAAEEPAFFIESIAVDGASAARIVVAESRLEEGETYSESELRDAMARIQRLPFVVWTDFRLGKGSQPGKFVLQISIRQMKPFFLNAAMLTRWTPYESFRPGPNGLEDTGEVVDQFRATELVAGARMFLGSRGVLNLVAQRVEDRNDRFTMAFSQYDLFGTRASLTAVVSQLDDPGAIRPGVD